MTNLWLYSKMKSLLFVILCLAIARVSLAAPGPPLEALLKRAETVTLARVAAVGRETVTFQPNNVLRGEPPAEITLHVGEGQASLFQVQEGADYLLLSQGDERNGPPKPVWAPHPQGQASYCGWLIYPLGAEDKQVCCIGVGSFVAGKETADGSWSIPLADIVRMVGRFAYDPQGKKQVLEPTTPDAPVSGKK